MASLKKNLITSLLIKSKLNQPAVGQPAIQAMRWKVKAEKCQKTKMVSVVVYEYGRWLAEVSGKLSAEALKEYLPHDVVDRVLAALRVRDHAEVEFEAESLPSWPWKPDANAVRAVYFLPSDTMEATDFLYFQGDSFYMKLDSRGSSRMDILKHFPAELYSEGERLYDKYEANPYFFCGIDIQRPNRN